MSLLGVAQRSLINWIRANDLAYGRPEDEESYRCQPDDVLVYNPEGLPFRENLLMDCSSKGIRKEPHLQYDLYCRPENIFYLTTTLLLGSRQLRRHSYC